jgi:drug/metabolite transporter (DMT)-like permease
MSGTSLMYRDMFFILLSALGFALSAVFAKLVMNSSTITAFELTFFRFASGFVLAGFYMSVKKMPLRPKNPAYVGLRAVFNVAAAVFFFLAVEYTTVTKSNLLNMTYPIFVFILAPYINKEKVPRLHYLFLALGMAGIYLVLMPDTGVFHLNAVNRGDLYGLISGLCAGFAIAYLRQARKQDSTQVILFYHMGAGMLLTFFLAVPGFSAPKDMVLAYVVLTTLASLTAQLFLTIGYRSIHAAAGAIVSCSRIFIAALLGVSIFADPLTLNIIAGGIVIIISLIGASGIVGRKTNRGIAPK